MVIKKKRAREEKRNYRRKLCRARRIARRTARRSRRANKYLNLKKCLLTVRAREEKEDKLSDEEREKLHKERRSKHHSSRKSRLEKRRKLRISRRIARRNKRLLHKSHFIEKIKRFRKWLHKVMKELTPKQRCSVRRFILKHWIKKNFIAKRSLIRIEKRFK